MRTYPTLMQTLIEACKLLEGVSIDYRVTGIIASNIYGHALSTDVIDMPLSLLHLNITNHHTNKKATMLTQYRFWSKHLKPAICISQRPLYAAPFLTKTHKATPKQPPRHHSPQSQGNGALVNQ